MAQIMGWGAMLGGLLLSVMLGVMPADIQILGDGDVEKFDLSELGDGETRTFGEGDHTITATREGDEISIKIAGKDGDMRTITCTANAGECMAITSGDGDGPQMFMLRNTVGGDDGDHRVEVVKIVSDHAALESHGVVDVWVGDHPGAELDEDVIVMSGGPRVLAFVGEGGHRLRCPEGDATLTLEEDDDTTYYCPKHNIEMEKADIPTMERRVLVIKEKDGDHDD